MWCENASCWAAARRADPAEQRVYRHREERRPGNRGVCTPRAWGGGDEEPGGNSQGDGDERHSPRSISISTGLSHACAARKDGETLGQKDLPVKCESLTC